MPQIQGVPCDSKPLAAYLRPLVIATSWVALVALVSGCFFAPRETEVQPTLDDVVGFGCSVAIAGAAAAIVAFGVGGRMRWAVELLLAVAALCSITLLFLAYFLWFDPPLARRQMDLWSFQRLQNSSRHWAEQLVGYHGPLGAIVGVVLGTVAGLLTVLGRYRPRLATCTALVILFTFASDTGRQIAFDLVAWLCQILRHLFVPWNISDDQISITGIIFGAVAGASIANLVMYATRIRAGTASPVQSH